MTPPPQFSKSIEGYVELATPQLLDDKWREFNFDLAAGQNILQDIVTLETASGYVYRDAKQIGSATHNRFIYWRCVNDLIELVEISPEIVLDDNQVRIRFVNSPVVNDVKVIEYQDLIVIIIATLTSVHRLYLPHPKLTNKSILADLTSDVLFNPSNYYIITQSAPNGQQPISATSWRDKSSLKCALSFPDSSLLIVQFGHLNHHITTSEIKQTGIIGRLWSKMPNLWAKSPNECDNAVFACIPLHLEEDNDVLLFTLCRDCRVRVFSTSSKECVCSYNMIPQTSFHQSFASHTNPTTETPSIRLFGNEVVVYLSDEFVFLDYSNKDGVHELNERAKVAAPSWEKLIDFSFNQEKIWALGSSGSESSLYYMDLERVLQESQDDATMFIENSWDLVGTQDEWSLQNVSASMPRSIVTEIFWSNHFSVATVQRALVGVAGSSIPKKNTMEELEMLAMTRIVDDNQEEAWTRFYNYCLQSHQAANKNIGLVVAENGAMISILKRSNPSFVCPSLMSVEDDGPFRGIESSSSLRNIIKPLNSITNDLMDDQTSSQFEQKLLESPALVMSHVEEVVVKLIKKLGNMSESRKNLFTNANTDRILAGFDYICANLDLTEQSRIYNERILNEFSTQMLSEHKPLGSHVGIIITFELFKQLVRARMTLARDLLLYIGILQKYADSGNADNALVELCDELQISGKLKTLMDCLRCYAVLVWLAETHVKSNTVQVSSDVINYLAHYFEFFKKQRDIPTSAQLSSLERIIHQHLFTSFLNGEGVNFCWSISNISHDEQTFSNSFYLTDTAINLCQLLWPKTDHICLPEFLYTQQLDDHLAKYLDLTEDWLENCDDDRHFLRAANCMLQNRATQGVEIFNRLWMKVSGKKKRNNIISRFLDLDEDKSSSTFYDETGSNPDLIYLYYEKLIQLFQTYNNRQCLVLLINHCMSLIDEKSGSVQQNRISTLRAKLFQYYLELEDSDEAYHTMVLTEDPSLRTNCLRKFIVSHCEKERWIDLLAYPFIDIKSDFISILNQKAETSDLSTLSHTDFYKTSYYDLLFASFVGDEDYRGAAEVMYNYAQRLAQEVPGITSIRKQADCLIVTLNTLRCVDEKLRFLELNTIAAKDNGRTSILKRSHDCELDTSSKTKSGDNVLGRRASCSDRIDCTDIERKYELTKARLRLLERDQSANAIALSPLTPEETIAQLVASSMFSAASDLALLFGSSMDTILDGLTAKYIQIKRLSLLDIAVHHETERGLSDIFTNSYSTIDTYNYVANSSSPLVERLWRLIDYYLTTYDGVGHKYQCTDLAETFQGTSVLMNVVANKLLASGCNVPASLRRLYFHRSLTNTSPKSEFLCIQRNSPELLRLFMKYDQLLDANELAVEMIDEILEPSGRSVPCPAYLPTHLFLLLISYLREDATNMDHIKAANLLTDRLNRYRNFIKTQ